MGTSTTSTPTGTRSSGSRAWAPPPPAPTLPIPTLVPDLDHPTNMQFLGPNDFLILEKASGKVKHVVNGQVTGALQFVAPGGMALPNLPVNNASERGLLGI